MKASNQVTTVAPELFPEDDLEISKSVSKTAAVVGDTLTYSISPAGSVSGKTITWEIASLAANSSLDLSFTVAAPDLLVADTVYENVTCPQSKA